MAASSYPNSNPDVDPRANPWAGEDVGRMRRDYTEAKNGFKTTEFMLTLFFIIAVIAATYLDDDSLSRADGWRYASFAVVAYSVGRGLAKLGVREPYTEEVHRRP